MALPAILGLLGLAGGALGQDWYFADEAKKGQEKLKGLLGNPPDAVPDGGYSNPTPGSGLMADPSNTQRQLEFMAGLMGMRPRDRAAARSLVEPILGRASQERVTKEGWGFQAEQAQIAEGHVNRRFEATQAGIEERFGKEMGFRREEFDRNEARYGPEQAWEQYKFGEQQAQHRRTEARLAASAAQQAELVELQIAAARRDAAGGAPIKLGVNYQPVMVEGPGGREVVAAPVAGTPDWVQGQEAVSKVDNLRGYLADLKASINAHGTEHFGEEAGRQSSLYNRVVAAIGSIDKLGTLQKSDLERMASEVPDPTSRTRVMTGQWISNDRFIAVLDQLDKAARQQQEAHQYQYRGWGLRMRPLDAAESAGGRSSPPAGSKPVK